MSRKESVMKIVLQVKGMVCEGCENRVCNSLKHIKGVEEVVASFKDEKVEIFVKKKDLIEDIKKRITDLGFQVIGETYE